MIRRHLDGIPAKLSKGENGADDQSTNQ